MATEAQIRANRLNALKSTGPRTATGKAAVAQNAVKHGLFVRQAVIAGEDPGEYEFYRDRMLAELSPEGMMEAALAQRAVGLAWRLRRAERLQNEAFEALLARDTTGPFARLTQSLRAREHGPLDSDGAEPDLTCGRVIVRDFANSRVLERLLMYERRLENSLYKTMAELRELRLLRQMEGLPTETEEEVSSASGDCEKQTQLASTPAEAKCCTGKDVDEDRGPAPAPEQSQSKPIPAGPDAGQSPPARSDSGAQADPGGFQPGSGALYSAASQGGCDLGHSTGTVMVRDRVQKESS